MIRKSTEILISGGGIAGLTSACAFAKAGFDVVCVDPLPPITDPTSTNSDLRSTAFLQPARNTLENAGLWECFEKYATPLEIMRLADAGGVNNEIRMVADFNALEISDAPFAWNLPNWLLRRELVKHIQSLSNVTLLFGQKTGRITTRIAENLVMVGNEQYSCQLLIGADGRNSSTRQEMKIPVKTWRYGQKAIAMAVCHSSPHKNISTEIHRSGGPFTTVPLPDNNGNHMSSIIWMEKSDRANMLYKMDEEQFNQELNKRSCNILGEIKLASQRNLWPIISQKSKEIYGQRFALIAEAAHVIPPIGAQGLNMSLRDLEALLELTNSHEIGSTSHLMAYHAERKSDIDLRIRGVDALNRAAMAENQNLRTLRLKALQTLHGLAPIRKTLMKKGLGA
jgi:2-octaprenyl-6-methoxyphenol hydroxylase